MINELLLMASLWMKWYGKVYWTNEIIEWKNEDQSTHRNHSGLNLIQAHIKTVRLQNLCEKIEYLIQIFFSSIPNNVQTEMFFFHCSNLSPRINWTNIVRKSHHYIFGYVFSSYKAVIVLKFTYFWKQNERMFI